MKPKYQVIIEDIKSKILSGDYNVGEQIPTESALQSLYEVSRQTVRKAILELSNEGFLRSEKGSGTYVSNQYRTKTGGSSHKKTIGVITTYISDYIFPSIIRGIESRMNEDNYSLLLASTNNDVAQEKKALEMMLSYGVDGLIIEPTKSNLYNPNIAYYLSFKEQDIPLIMINAFYEEIELPFLCLDDVQSSYLATKELISKGHSQIGLIAKMDDLQGKYRMKGYIKALEEAKLRFYPEQIFSFNTETKQTLATNLKDFLNKNRDTLSAIVCYNDEVGLEVVNACRQLDISIPEELSIIGQDNSYIAQNANIKLTTLTHPQETMGRDAADWVIKKLQGKKDLPNNTYYQPVLIEGETVVER
ncbi:GntR family transcriptional regulator [Paenibacillus sp. FSL R7-0048]|jgi:GntR family transcriptional regulator of arabinose operon|uniref:GntR family transcriptional regulator n=1 Tax=Paenibacillus odorifer TaxID=189426 RepID=A0ABX3GYQ0_9BACL|nr:MULTISPECIES: GntR family transcriptional regulator [Paenibacillus]MDH6427451.1 GntR family transcriptional regulator of arabinose operon [Paenibacillus sp. PastH-4]MDH6443481.1 GntR family transcriptional regulator of arabinose operon [Paenibacillus sp. PastF-4]MDH6525815.1 GntR family transcriptional regulator of arabinose operon [Paenibacillus sp. PastH-3]OMC74532.1 GntR family transcriptional regulator [Paenibacillus odorifer]OMC80553.1 GntR family transcriptional regulator [Paenibacill